MPCHLPNSRESFFKSAVVACCSQATHLGNIPYRSTSIHGHGYPTGTFATVAQGLTIRTKEEGVLTRKPFPFPRPLGLFFQHGQSAKREKPPLSRFFPLRSKTTQGFLVGIPGLTILSVSFATQGVFWILE